MASLPPPTSLADLASEWLDWINTSKPSPATLRVRRADLVAIGPTYITAAIDQLRREGAITSTDDLSRLSPTLRDHINPYGRYTFDLDDPGASLRPLRKPEHTYAP